jgi:cytosine/adenosine deaminase-related metal-dependent hydrolase
MDAAAFGETEGSLRLGCEACAVLMDRSCFEADAQQ